MKKHIRSIFTALLFCAGLSGTAAGAGTYHAFFYDTVNECYNTDNSTAAVMVRIYPPCKARMIITNPMLPNRA